MFNVKVIILRMEFDQTISRRSIERLSFLHFQKQNILARTALSVPEFIVILY